MKVCGKKRVGGMMRKVCKCWNESIEGHVKEKTVV